MSKQNNPLNGAYRMTAKMQVHFQNSVSGINLVSESGKQWSHSWDGPWSHVAHSEDSKVVHIRKLSSPISTVDWPSYKINDLLHLSVTCKASYVCYSAAVWLAAKHEQGSEHRKVFSVLPFSPEKLDESTLPVKNCKIKTHLPKTTNFCNKEDSKRYLWKKIKQTKTCN